MSTPKRIQRQRTKGWRMPEGAVYVGRPSRWGNPWALTDPGVIMHPRPDNTDWDADDLVRWFRQYALHAAVGDPEWLAPLSGRDLACWCPLEDADGKPVPCHADVLLELANR